MKKILFFILVLTLTLSVFTFSSFAEESGESATDATGEITLSEGSGENVFAELYETVVRHADKIFSALAFIGSLIIAFAYRRGLLPVIKGALSTVADATARLKEKTEAASKTATETVLEAAKKLETAEGMMQIMTDRLDKLHHELDLARKEQERCGEFKTVLSSQIDMLYEIFMSSSLPQYQKEAVGNKVAEMRKRLAACDVNTKDESHD
ncbi:MAG: hypothetical protein J6V09_03300 [Clostridia bacterium]|nr:hypothetical protein [Clostridia bacterium]